MTDPAIQEWLYAREVMRRLGFTPDELFFVVSTSGKVKCSDSGVISDHGGPIIALVLRAQGREFSWTIAATKLPAGEIEEFYRKAVDDWNRAAFDIDLKRLDSDWRASRPYAMRLELAAALHAKGFLFGIPSKET